MKEKCILSINLDDARPFYTAGDFVSGYVRAVVLSKVHLTDLDLRLQCEERSAVPVNKRDIKNADTRKIRNVQERMLHYLTVQHPLQSESGEQTVVLDPGEYTYPFAFHLPEDVNSLPPHAPIFQTKRLTTGVWWSLIAMAHRRKSKPPYKASADVPVQPLSPPVADALRGGRSTVSGAAVVHEKPSFVELLKGERAAAKRLEAEFSYPQAGLPQYPRQQEFRLVLRCDALTVQVSGIEATILRKCRAKAKQLEYTYEKEYTLGVARMSRSLSSESLDVSDALSQFMIPEVLVAPFASKLLAVTYELRLKVLFVPLVPAQAKPSSLVIETPINLLSGESPPASSIDSWSRLSSSRGPSDPSTVLQPATFTSMAALRSVGTATSTAASMSVASDGSATASPMTESSIADNEVSVNEVSENEVSVTDPSIDDPAASLTDASTAYAETFMTDGTAGGTAASMAAATLVDTTRSMTDATLVGSIRD